MNRVSILNIRPIQDYFPAQQNFGFDVALRSSCALPNPLQWKVIFIGSSDKENYDQLLEEFEVPIQEAYEFQFKIQAPPPDLSKLPTIEEVFDVTAVMIMVLYNDQEFFRCSFLVSHQYDDQMPRETFTEQGLFRAIYTKEPPRTVVKDDFCWDDQIANVKNMINPDQVAALNQISTATNEMIMKIDNPFQLTEHSMFHPSNIEKQSNFDTNMPYQGFLAKDLGGQAQAGNHNGYSGPSMFNN